MERYPYSLSCLIILCISVLTKPRHWKDVECFEKASLLAALIIIAIYVVLACVRIAMIPARHEGIAYGILVLVTARTYNNL